jgi:pSer/pThr/pTyr-binding forkhead associated (FHA) protein
MKLRLMVMTEGNNRGKILDITLAQFVIGRDPQCHLRPASALISKRHCALIKREGKAFLCDFDSTNGTFLNDAPVKGEVELSDGDMLKIGPLEFRVQLEASVAINKPTPMPPGKTPAPSPSQTAAKAPAGKATKSAAQGSDDDEIAALLLDDGPAEKGDNSQSVPEGSTVMDLAAMAAESTKEESAAGGAPGKPDDKSKVLGAGNTQNAAESILKKYMKRSRK